MITLEAFELSVPPTPRSFPRLVAADLQLPVSGSQGSDMYPRLPSLLNHPPLIDDHVLRLALVSANVAARTFGPLADHIALESQTQLRRDVHESLGKVWANPVSGRREIHHRVLWSLAQSKYTEWDAGLFWQELTNRNRYTAIYGLAKNAVEFVTLARQAEQQIDGNIVSRFVRQRMFRRDAFDLATLLYGFDEYEMAVAHSRDMQKAGLRRQAAQLSFV